MEEVIAVLEMAIHELRTTKINRENIADDLETLLLSISNIEESDGICQDCGKAPGNITNCPYVEEISGQYVEICVCPKCYRERMMDI